MSGSLSWFQVLSAFCFQRADLTRSVLQAGGGEDQPAETSAEADGAQQGRRDAFQVTKVTDPLGHRRGGGSYGEKILPVLQEAKTRFQ